MANTPRPNGLASGSGIIKPSVGARTKEDWIGSQLKKVYDEALSEEIPSDMLDLLASLDDGDKEEQDSSEEHSR
ncbi:MAG: hypothetical protein Tsb0019_02770 [Roseibium sp.]